MKRKVVIMCVFLSVICSTFFGCKTTEDTQDTLAPQKLTIWTPMHNTSVVAGMSEYSVAVYDELEKLTGVEIEFIYPSLGKENEEFDMMIASRKLPDMILYDWVKYPGGVEQAVRDGIIIPVNDYMDEYTPNLKKAYSLNSEYKKQSVTDSGLYCGFPSLNEGDYRTFGGLMLRRDWLDELGLNVPQTINEWETVLRAFKNKKGAVAPFTANEKMFEPGSRYNSFNNCFGVGTGFYVQDGTVKFGPIESGYREWIDRMNKWYSEGLIDNDFATNSKKAIDSKILNGSSGAFFGYIGSDMGYYLPKLQDANPAYDLIAAPYPMTESGGAPMHTSTEFDVNQPWLCITTACDNPELAAKWADALYSEKGRMLNNFGIEGESYEMINGKPVYTDVIINNPDGLSICEALEQYCFATNLYPGFNQAEEYLMQYYPYTQQTYALEMWAEQTVNSKKYMFPPVTFNEQESVRISTINLGIYVCIKENITKFVHGTRPMSEWDDFVNNLKRNGVEELISIYQTAYDRYQKR